MTKIRLTSRMRSSLTFLTVSLAGLAVWLGIQGVSGSSEAWDSDLFFLIGLPSMWVVTAVAGFLQPKRWWLWGVAVVFLQAVVLFLQSPAGPLWIVGLAFSGVLAATCTISALVGKTVRERRLNRATRI